VLDVAAGKGRHTRYFLHRGHPVTAIDHDMSALTPAAGDEKAEIIEADLEGCAPWPLSGRRFKGIVVTNYLHRPLFPHILDALDDDGVLIYETFAAGNEAYGRPRSPDFLLAPGELLEVVRDRLNVVAYEHGTIDGPHKAVVQRICACLSGADPARLVGLPA